MNSIRLFLLAALCALLPKSVFPQSFGEMRLADRMRIAEAITISKQFGERLWVGWEHVPFTLILVTDSVEYLIHHPSPSPDFVFQTYDSMLSSDVYCRKTTLGKNLLATFPAVNGVNTIVVGTPENTGRNSTDWIITLLHEHFHHYTYSSPGYTRAVDSLDLSGGDQTGMWMLNYPFPYSGESVVTKYVNYASALATCVQELGADSFEATLRTYLAARQDLRKVLTAADYRYFSFQVWQEGIARYTEYKILELLKEYRPSRFVSDLPDFVPFEKYKQAFLKQRLNQLSSYKLEINKRECFYAVGLAEGLILDRLNPNWRSEYLQKRFFVETYADAFEK